MSAPVILLVEDNPDDAELAALALAECAPTTQVRIARSGPEALDLLLADDAPSASERPVMVLLDLNLPRLGGLEVLRRLRSDARTRYLPVVVLTSSAEERDLAQSYQLGANSYVQKPVDFVQFQSVARQLTDYWLGLNRVPQRSAG